MHTVITLLIIAIVAAGGLFLFTKHTLLERITDIPQHTFEQTELTVENFENAPALTTYVRNRSVIWAMGFLPDGRMLFTERGGVVSVVEVDGRVREILTLDVHSVSESGLHGIAIDPHFDDNHFVYLYYTYRDSGADTLNRVSRFIFENGVLSGEHVVVDTIPGAPTHDGGRIKFGPDGFLYITTGDAQTPSLAQDRHSLAGKILRVTTDGDAAPGNPFDTHIYSYGHRNPQGITWDSEGRLWATEHGPAARDELNLIEPGANYGWPEITGTETRTGMRSPIIQSGQSTWAPAGAAYHNGSLFFTGLRGSALYEYALSTQTLTTHLEKSFGRIRDVVVGPDGFLYIATSNRDGRGVPVPEDDRILKINPHKLSEM